MRYLMISAAVALVAGCNDDSTGVRHPPPAFEHAVVAANPNNVLSAIVSVRVRNADIVTLRYRVADSSEGENATPPVPILGDSAKLPLLGIHAGRRYLITPVATGPAGITVGNSLEFTTDELPSDLPTYVASGTAPAQGYVVFAANPYGLAIDNTGRVVWYHRFPNGLGLNFMAQPNGRFVARPPTPIPNDIEPWIEIDALGNTTRTLSCAHGLQPRLHDLIARPDGSYWILCDETRTLDLSEFGIPAARVTGTAVQHISSSGALLFHWSPFDHFTITAADISDRNGSSINWTHGNAIDLDFDGNPIVSFRNLNEITKIDRVTGAVIWRLGGQSNQFTFAGTQVPAFSRQHGVRAPGPGVLLLLDNLGDPGESRAELYQLNTTTMTAQLVSSYASRPGIVTQIGGSVQSVSIDRLLVSFGTAGRVEEHHLYGGIVWQIEGNAGYVFRAQRIESLYAPGVGSSR